MIQRSGRGAQCRAFRCNGEAPRRQSFASLELLVINSADRTRTTMAEWKWRARTAELPRIGARVLADERINSVKNGGPSNPQKKRSVVPRCLLIRNAMLDSVS